VEGRERVPPAVCVRVSYILTHVHGFITFTRPRESSSMLYGYARARVREREEDGVRG